MIRKIASWILYNKLGWKKHITEDHPEKFILCLAPHTSNWDFVMGQLYSAAEGMRINFLMKKEWFFWPLGSLFRKLGGIPVYRSKHMSMTDNLADTAMKSNSFRLCITPEGTRSLNTEWKKGFYFIAQKANLPILLYGLDYADKKIVCTKTFYPTGNVEKDMEQIKEYFRDFKGKHPEQFSI